MMRLYLALGGIAAIAAIIGAVYFMGGRAASDRAKVNQLEGTLENAETLNKGADGPSGDQWFDWLFPDTASD